MSKNVFHNVKMTAQVVIVPKQEIDIYDEAQYYGNSIKRIDRMRKMVGFHKRRVSEKGVTPAAYAIAAAEKVFQETGIDRNSIDALVYMTQIEDFLEPSTCFYIHNKLKLSQQCAVFTVNHGCPAWAYGMYLSSMMIESGAHRRVLLLCADTPSIGVDPADRNSAPLFGDAGCATILEYAQDTKLIYFNIETFSDGYEAIITPLTGARANFVISNPDDRKRFKELMETKVKMPSGYEMYLLGSYMDGIQVFDFSISEVPKNIKDLMKYAGVREKDIKWLCLHQANKQIIQTVGSESGFPLEKVPYWAFENYGNNTMCSVPSILNSVVKDSLDGETTVLCSAFGNGLSIASLIITLAKDVKLCGIYDWEKPADFMTREEFIEYWKNKIANTKH